MLEMEVAQFSVVLFLLRPVLTVAARITCYNNFSVCLSLFVFFTLVQTGRVSWNAVGLSLTHSVMFHQTNIT